MSVPEWRRQGLAKLSGRKTDNTQGLDPNVVFASDLLYAIKHPFRLQILAVAAEERVSAPSLSQRFGVSLGYASYHLIEALDKAAGLVVHVETRGAREERFYELNWDKIRSEIDWPKIPQPLRSSLQGSVAVPFIQQLISAFESGSIASRADTTLAWRRVAVDELGWSEIRRIVQEAEARVEDVVSESVVRLEGSISKPIDMHFALAVFEDAGHPKAEPA